MVYDLFNVLLDSDCSISLKDYFSPLNFLAVLAKYQLTITVRVYFWTPDSLPFIFMSVSILTTTLS